MRLVVCDLDYRQTEIRQGRELSVMKGHRAYIVLGEGEVLADPYVVTDLDRENISLEMKANDGEIESSFRFSVISGAPVESFTSAELQDIVDATAEDEPLPIEVQEALGSLTFDKLETLYSDSTGRLAEACRELLNDGYLEDELQTREPIAARRLSYRRLRFLPTHRRELRATINGAYHKRPV